MFQSVIDDLLKKYQRLNAEVPAELSKLLSFTKKQDLERYCRSFTLESRAFASLIMNAPRLNFQHVCQHREFRPAHLAITEADMQSLRASVQPGGAYPKKMLQKVGRMFEERKQVHAHIFVKGPEWHMFYFSGGDTGAEGQHWKHGPHVHFVNHLWQNVAPETVWKSFEDRKSMHPGVHIRWVTSDYAEPQGQS